MRRLRQCGKLTELGKWRSVLAISAENARGVVRAPTFGIAWNVVEGTSPCLRRYPLRPADLPDQIAGARHALGRLRAVSLFAHQNVDPKRIVATAADNVDGWTDHINEEFGGFVPA